MIEILMTIKDRQDYLLKQIAYLSPYLSPELTLTIYDDGSEQPLSLNDNCPHVRLIRGDVNVGLIEARNILLAHSFPSSEHVLFLDDDIFIYNFRVFINSAVNSLRSDSNLLAVSCPYINLPAKKYGMISTFKKIYDTDKSDSDYVVYFFGGTSLFDRDKLLELGGLEGKYRIYLEEEDLALRAFASSLFFKILYENDFIAIHDQAPGKNFDERAIFLLSNRMLFHYKFMRSVIARGVLNSAYILIYLIKQRKFSMVLSSVRRYNLLKSDISMLNYDSSTVFSFFKRRFF